MPHRNTVAAHKLKAELIAQLGGKCQLCPETNPDRLQFDHIHGRDYEPSRLSYLQRLIRYRREAAEQKLRLLCGDCNLAVRITNDNGRFVPTGSHIPRTADIPFQTQQQ